MGSELVHFGAEFPFFFWFKAEGKRLQAQRPPAALWSCSAAEGAPAEGARGSDLLSFPEERFPGSALG